MRKRKMSALQMKYFGKKKKSHAHTRTIVRENVMARKSRTSRRARTSFRRSARRSSSGGNGINLSTLGAAAVYGAVRAPATKMIPDTVPQFAGKYTGNVIRGAASWFLAKNTTGFVREIGKAGLTVEAASVGASLTQDLNIGTNTASTSGVVMA